MATIAYANDAVGTIAVFRRHLDKWDAVYSATFPLSVREIRCVRSVRYDTGLVVDCDFHPEQSLFAYISYGGELILVDLSSGHGRAIQLPLATFDVVRFLQGDLLVLTTLADTTQASNGCLQGNTVFVDTTKGTVVNRIWPSNRCIEVIAEGSLLLLGESGQNAGFIRFASCDSGGLAIGRDYVLGFTEGYCDFRLSPSGRLLAVLGKTSCAFFCLFDLANHTCIRLLTWPLQQPSFEKLWLYPKGVAFLHQESQIALPNYVDGSAGLILLDVETGTMQKAAFGHQSSVNSLDVSLSGGVLVSGDLDGTVNTTTLSLVAQSHLPLNSAVVDHLRDLPPVDCHTPPTVRNVQWVQIDHADEAESPNSET